MNTQDKLNFIYSIPKRLADTDHRGCECDWFLHSYDKHNPYQSKFGNPKYIKIKYNETQWEAIYILKSENKIFNRITYEFYGRGNVACDSLNIKNELLYLNGQIKDSRGKLTYTESTEEELVDFMYKIAYNYYINDIEPNENIRKVKEDIEGIKSDVAQTYFKLKGE